MQAGAEWDRRIQQVNQSADERMKMAAEQSQRVVNVRSHKYPLIRFLYICVNKPTQQPLGDPAAEFLRFLLSWEGQQIVAAGGNIPLDEATVEQGRRTLAD
jgi:ABC-type phosphate transport system substrate-binding protein